MPLPRFQKLEIERRDGILDAATREFAKHGFDGASYNQIIEEAGISKGAMYYYFADKDDLFRTVIDETSRRLVEALEIPTMLPADAATFWLECEAIYGRMLSYLAEHPTQAEMCWSLIRARTRGTAHEAVIESDKRLMAVTEQLLQLGQQVGAVRTDLPSDMIAIIAFSMLEGMDRWLMTHWEEVQHDDLSSIARRTVSLMQRVAEPQKGDR